jgi:hypothetical protein
VRATICVIVATKTQFLAKHSIVTHHHSMDLLHNTKGKTFEFFSIKTKNFFIWMFLILFFSIKKKKGLDLDFFIA